MQMKFSDWYLFILETEFCIYMENNWRNQEPYSLYPTPLKYLTPMPAMCNESLH